MIQSVKDNFTANALEMVRELVVLSFSPRMVMFTPLEKENVCCKTLFLNTSATNNLAKTMRYMAD